MHVVNGHAHNSVHQDAEVTAIADGNAGYGHVVALPQRDSLVALPAAGIAGDQAAAAIDGSCPSKSNVAERSEEHTSELQSQSNLVCRLLLEKKKISNTICRHALPLALTLLLAAPHTHSTSTTLD